MMSRTALNVLCISFFLSLPCGVIADGYQCAAETKALTLCNAKKVAYESSGCKVRYSGATFYEVGTWTSTDLNLRSGRPVWFRYDHVDMQIEEDTTCIMTICTVSTLGDCAQTDENVIKASMGTGASEGKLEVDVPASLDKVKMFSFRLEGVRGVTDMEEGTVETTDKDCEVQFRFLYKYNGIGAWQWDDLDPKPRSGDRKGLGYPTKFSLQPGVSCVLTLCTESSADCAETEENSVTISNPSNGILTGRMDVPRSLKRSRDKFLSFRLERVDIEQSDVDMHHYKDGGNYEFRFSLDSLIGIVVGILISFVIGLTMHNCSIWRASSSSKTVKMLIG